MAARPTSVKNLVLSEGFRSRVLVIDDEPLIRWALSAGLTAAGYDTVAAANAGEAREMARRRPRPEVILLDLHQTDCWELLADLKAIVPACHVMVLGTRPDADRPARWQGLEFIPKPFDLADVAHRIETALASQASLAEVPQP